ncbi:MAG: acyl-CoA--6-aminopenicillanic acid acyltransferase [Lachnospiraceae bacterium]|nr:acyl-CoA--6-aminopenicillanic acid acyltransferase [Lachnospiraceae bacterium]
MMEKQKVSYFELKGSYKEIGRQMAKRMKEASALEQMQFSAPEYIAAEDLKEARNIYEKYCPGLLEELEGFAEESGIPAERISYSWMTYLVPRCSGLILGGNRTEDGHMKLIRNYEFSIEDEDLTVTRTAPEGKYAHVSGNIACFGRCEGINECGLAVSMSSCGFPVSNMRGMRAPKVRGLQFWAVIRTVLENCKDVEEALNMLNGMPIAYNINLLLADKKHNGVLFETMDGERAWRRLSKVEKKVITEEKEAQKEKVQKIENTERTENTGRIENTENTENTEYLAATNHIVIPEFQVYEPVGMRNSIIRFKNVTQFAESKLTFTEKEMKQFMFKKYPDGMTCYCYEDWFGTIRTVLMDIDELRYSVCWFGLEENGWKNFSVMDPICECVEEKKVIKERAGSDMFEMVPIKERES